MEKIAFVMQLNPGQAEIYKQRHDDIWPELAAQLKQAGVSDYSIFLHPDTHQLFAVLKRSPDHSMSQLPDTAIVKAWWQYMADIMETHTDNSPVSVDLTPVFHLD
ncbi:L-rhamnose mutarotase [Marinimicrobium alkaliphilum]|uniref:L-rhamnose mutarotase n=1 Tax=Marinimicrobium alkaliphilum TaxID=2202654 RepID=UPI000DB99BF3|nr:L-rhamnose mutarotase [Marinimicrobium alkaliphilum]